jgi:hypothetical protein
MGQVWAARLHGGRGFQKLVAIKTILPQSSDLPLVERMMQQEARLAAHIQHPNVVHTIDLGEHEGTLYLVMEWVDGEPLHRVMRRAYEREPVPLSVAVNLVAQACRGLHAAHEARDEDNRPLGLVHRDVSPQNILITHTGTAKLFDFGIAKAMNEASSLTEVGEVKGKFSYMAPEQLLGKAVDRRADVFAMGIVLYWLTAGRHPFKDDNPGETVLNITNAEPPLPSSRYVPSYPAELERVVLKALEKAPERRFETAEQLCSALQHAVPQAFALGVDKEIRDYLGRVIGDLAAERRALLRRAQEAVNRWRILHGEGGDGTPSAGSLRALVVDAPETDSAVQRLPSGVVQAAEPALPPPEPAAARARPRWRVWAAPAAALAVTLGLAVALTQPEPSSNAGAPALVRELDAPSPSAARSAQTRERIETVPAPAASAPASAVPAASASAAPPASAARPPSKAKPKAAAPSRAKDGRDLGLLPPEY